MARDRPVEDERRLVVRSEVATLAAFVVGGKEERTPVDALEQHHARGRCAAGACRRKRHRVRLGSPGALSLPVPTAEDHEWLGGGSRLVKWHASVYSEIASCGTYFRSCSSAARCRRETCIWLMPNRRAISD